MPLAPGTSIGPYQIISAIGAGGMGEVYLAKDTRLKRNVAVKVLPEAFANDRERLSRITREAEVLASLNHPNIATLFGMEDRALVMEVVEGQAPHGPMSFDSAWKIALQIIDALEYAHDKGIVHRDLKPANVKVTEDGIVKLLDFGLAKAFIEPRPGPTNQEHSPTLSISATQVGVILGTAAYMAPEQVKGKSVDRRADVWAFGVVLYELLTGRRLFDGEDVSEILAQILTKEPDLSDVPARARKLLRRCLEKDPKKRLRDIGEARHYVDDPPAAALRARNTRVVPWAISGALLVLASAAYWLRPHHELPPVRSFILPPAQSRFRCQGDDAGPAVLSPDGTHLAFAAPTAEGKIMLWVRPLDSLDTKPLAGTEGAIFPFWSPNSRSLGFFADAKLKTIDVSGGIVNVLTDAPATRGGTWSSGDVIVFVPRLTSSLVRIPATGGVAKPVTHLDEKQQEMSHRWPSFLPDSKHVLYTSRTHGVFVTSLDGSDPPRRLLEESTNALYAGGFLLYGRGNSVMARRFDPGTRQFTGVAVTVAQPAQAEISSDRTCFTASANGLLAYHFGVGDSQLTWIDRAGNRRGTLGDPGLFDAVEIAPDGKRAAAVLSDGSGGATLWIYEFGRPIRRRFSVANAYNIGVAWSSDSRRVVVGSKRDSSYVLSAKAIDGAGDEELLFRSRSEIAVGSWLPNGGLTVWTRNPKTGWDIAYVPPEQKGRERTPIPVLHGPTDETGGLVSPDGRWILFNSGEPGDLQLDAYVAAFPSGAHKRQVSNTGADLARWSRDGKEILYANHTKMMAASVRQAADTLDIGAPRLLFEMRGDCTLAQGTCFDVAPDGNRFLILEPTGSPQPVALIQNWTAGLKK